MDTNYRYIVEALTRFIDSDVFHYLRSDTRREFWQFRETLSNGAAASHRLDCEGFDKYLDSLSFVSRRGVLIKHDTDLKQKIAGDLERAVKFAALLPDVVCDVIDQAFVKAERLSGLDDDIDALALQWAALSAQDRTDMEQALPLCQQLLELVRPARAGKPVDENDLF